MLFGKHINKFYLKYAHLFLIAIIALVSIDYLSLYIPEFTGQIVDFFDGKSLIVDEETIKDIIIKIIIISTLIFIGRITYRFSLFYASKGIEASLRDEMFLKASRLSLNFYHNNKIGGIMSIFTTDLETIEEFYGWGTVTLVDAIFLSIIALIKMFRLNWVLTCICLIPAILICIWGFFVEKIMSKKWEERQVQYDQIYNFSQETFTGIRVIKAFVKENAQIIRFSKLAQKNKDYNIQFVRISCIFDSCISLLTSLITSLILSIGSYIVYCKLTGNPLMFFGQEVTLSAGNLITFAGYFDALVWPLIALGQIFTMKSRSKTSLKRISNFLDAEEEIKIPSNPIYLNNPKGKISFNNFSFKYPSSSNYSLKNVNLTINPGETIGIIGKIGSGKTTLVNSLLRLYNVDNNSILIDDNDIMQIDIKNIRDSIAYVPQDNYLFSSSIEDNIKFSNLDLSTNEVKKAAEFASISQDIESFPEKYKTMLGERGVNLSGGQKQRISIARAYIKDSPILILDDSVSACDLKTEENILNNIKSLRKGKTTILIANRISTVSKLDKIIVLNDGMVEAFDSHSNLLKISPTYKKMDYLQTLEKEVNGND